MKKILFDIDDTLIPFRSDYLLCYKTLFKKYNYLDSDENSDKLFKTIGKYEKEKEVFKKDELLDYINKEFDTNFEITFIDDLLDLIGDNWYHECDKDLKNILDYLSSKYELYVVTNWFADCQRKRLEHLNIDKYFKHIIGGETAIKPNKKAYSYFNDYENCIMIGDRVEIDLITALELGMDAILIDAKNKYPDYEGVKIKDLEELKDIL